MKKLILLLTLLNCAASFASTDSTSAVTYITFKGRGNSPAFSKERIAPEPSAIASKEILITEKEEALVQTKLQTIQQASFEASKLQSEYRKTELKGKMKNMPGARKLLKKLNKLSDPDLFDFYSDLFSGFLLAMLIACALIGLVAGAIIVLAAMGANPLIVLGGVLILLAIAGAFA